MDVILLFFQYFILHLDNLILLFYMPLTESFQVGDILVIRVPDIGLLFDVASLFEIVWYLWFQNLICIRSSPRHIL